MPPPRWTPKPRLCAVCGTDFLAKSPNAKYCGEDCKATGRRQTEEAVRRADPAAWKARQREALLKHRYGLENGEFAAMLEAQGSRCAICRGTPPRGQQWHVDHDHHIEKTHGKRESVAGILCPTCNWSLAERWYVRGRWITSPGRDPEWYENAAEYLRRGAVIATPYPKKKARRRRNTRTR